MVIRVFSQQGTYTTDNRDVVSYSHSACGTATLFIVLDGATSCPSSGNFSRELAELITAHFEQLPTQALTTERDLLAILKTAQAALQHKYVNDCSSLLLALSHAEQLLVMHSGDCCLGVIDSSSRIDWKIRVHTAANALSDASVDKIKNDPYRHQLTRSFKAKKYITPEMQYLKFPSNTNIIMATDGFWALTSAEQHALISQTAFQFEPEDDTSFILFEIT
jgi:serine/threonine protein phosphatase PrpC